MDGWMDGGVGKLGVSLGQTHGCKMAVQTSVSTKRARLAG